MARAFYTPIDLNKLEALNLRIQQLATAPSSPVEGLVYWNTTDHTLRAWDGSAWIDCTQQNVALDFGESSDISGSAPGDTVSAGSTGEVADAGHRHARSDDYGTTVSTQAVGDASSAGASANVSRADHKHAMPSFGNVTAQTSFGASSGNGSSSSIARTDHTHGTPAHDGTAHSSVSLSSLSAPTGDLSVGTYKITNLGTPTAGTDAATKAYVDAARSGLDVKQSVRAATTASGTLADDFADGDEIDGVTLATGDRILIKNQGTAENGIYTVNASGAPTRATDFDSSDEVTPGAFVFVEEGTVNADSGWVVTNDGGITVGTTVLTFAQFSGAGQITAGSGLSKTGNTLNIGAGTGITVNADTVAIDTAVVARKYATTLSTSSTSYTVTHGLNTKDVIVQVFSTDSTGAQVEVDVEHDSTSSVTLRFAVAPSADAYRVVVTG